MLQVEISLVRQPRQQGKRIMVKYSSATIHYKTSLKTTGALPKKKLVIAIIAFLLH